MRGVRPRARRVSCPHALRLHRAHRPLRAPLTTFIGREHEQALVGRLFGAAAAVPATRGTRFLLFERRLQGRWLAMAAHALGEPVAAVTLAEGRDLALEPALADVLHTHSVSAPG